MADEAKAKGNAAFSSGDFNSAVNHFTDAINLTPTNHVLFSNRSAAHASLNHYDEALSDAKKTVELKPDWGKGYSRLGAAHLGLNQFDEAVEAYSKGLEIDPSNEGLKSGLADAKASASRSRASAPNPFGDAFQGPEMWSKLTADPSTRGLLKQPDFVNMMKEIQRNPSNLNLYLQDQRVMQALGVLLNIQIRTQQAGDDMEIGEEEMAVPSRKEPEVEKKRKPEPEPEPEPEFGEEKQKKLKAQKEKELGNAAYKKKDFETAIQHYSTAMEIDDEDISYITNRAAVHLEMGKV
jgi:stress-induced-phosphoprotein 1